MMATQKFYEPCFIESDLRLDIELVREKIMSFVIKLVFAEGSSTLHKVCHSMCRFESMEAEQILATLMSQFGSKVRPRDFQIDPLFCLDTPPSNSREGELSKR